MASRAARRSILLIAVLALVVLGLAYSGGLDAARRSLAPLEYREIIASESLAAGVDPYLVAGMIRVESGFDPNAVSRADAVGLMQVKPSTARSIARQVGIEGKMNATTLTDPERNIRVGTAYLAYLIARYEGDETRALAAYNGGLTNADAWAAKAKESGRSFTEVIDFPETAAYVGKVRMQRDVYRVLYPGVFAEADE